MKYAIIIVVAIIVLLGLYFISVSNKLNKMVIKIDEAESGIDVALTKRYDLLTKAVAVAKGYAKHEQETIFKTIEMRNVSHNASMEEKNEYAAKQAEAIKAINVVAEQYPNLKADTQFTAIQNHIGEVEEQLQAARRLYNSNVSTFNQTIVVFPSSVIANMKHLTKRAFFEAEEGKREDVKIEF